MSRIHVRPFPVLFAAFVIIPIIEVYLLIQVGSLIGALPTIGLVVLTAVLGVALLRAQGLRTYLRLQRSLSEGRYPATEILEGVALLVGGALLLTPGFFTDFVGFVCLVPLTRQALISWSHGPLCANLSKHPAQRSRRHLRRGNHSSGRLIPEIICSGKNRLT